MSQQKKLERVLDLLLSEDSDQAAELLHQIIVEKARVIYETIVEEEDFAKDDTVGGEPDEDFTDEIASDKDEVDSDEENGGEAGGDDEADDDESDDSADDEFGGEDDEFDDEGDGSVEDRVEDLESQLADLRAEFDELMGEEMQEPQHADMMGGDDEFGDDEFGDDEVEPADDEFGGEDDFEGDGDGLADNIPDFGGGGGMPGGKTKVIGELEAKFFEKKNAAALKNADAKKKLKKADAKKKKANEETQFLNKVGDTGQRGKAGLVGTGKGMSLGAEQTQSPYTHAPSRKDYGGTAKNILGGGPTGGEYGKWKGDSAKNDTPSDNVKVEPKKNGVKADTTAKWTGGKTAGDGFAKSPLTKKPS